MTKYLISFPSGSMDVRPEDLPSVAEDAHAVVAEAKAAGVYVFSGGINESVDPVLVDADGTATDGTYPGSRLDGGYAVLDLPDRDSAVAWAAKLAAACRCAQELREFGDDPDA